MQEKFNPDQARFTSRTLAEKKGMSRLVPDGRGARMTPVSTVSGEQIFEGGTTVMSTLAVVEEILRETAVPMSVREIVERAGARLPSKSKTPDTVVARDLSMDIKKKGEGSLFIRTSPGRYTLRALAANSVTTQAAQPGTSSMSALPQRKPAAPAASRPRSDSDVQGGGFAG